MTIDEAQAEVKRCNKALSELRITMEEELAEVRRRFFDPIRDAQNALATATSAREVAQSEAAPDHEWTGKRVFKMEDTVLKSSFGWQKIGEKRVEGVVEMMRPGVTWPQKYRIPDVGEPFVRLLKKDGKPGVKCEHFMSWRDVRWQLVEAPDAPR